MFARAAKPSDTPGTPTPTPASEEPVATVASFEGGVLKITLPDRSTVSGKVTEETWISCGCDHSFQHEGWQGDQGDESNGGPGLQHHDDAQMPESESCGVSALVPGAKIRDAELNVSGAGAVWEKVELLPSPRRHSEQDRQEGARRGCAGALRCSEIRPEPATICRERGSRR